MKLFLWRQKDRRIESRTLLRWSIEEYEAAKQNQKPYRESELDSLFEFVSKGTDEQLEVSDMGPTFDIVEAPGGKPLVVDEKGEPYPLHVSVTHTGDWWIGAVGEHPVGIDAELRSRKVDPRLVRRICTKEELHWLDQETAHVSEDLREERLCEKLLWLWVRKEAYVKYLGTGIGEGLKTFSVVQERTAGDFREKDGYQTVELCGIPEAEHALELAVYAPEEEIEEIIWRNW